jgi:hypothetical protein
MNALLPYWCYRRRLSWLIASIALIAIMWAAVLAASHRFSLSPQRFAIQLARVVEAPLSAIVYRADLSARDRITASYQQGPSGSAESGIDSWKSIAAPAGVALVATRGPTALPDVPFVYQSPDAPYLVAFRQKHQLDRIVQSAGSEYESMLALATWVGSRWDHGTDKVPGGNNVCDPVAVVAAGQKGARYWCEIAARTAVHAAASMGWPVRMITASRDGYTWEHAVAELWSNQFAKWFVVDTDFNIVYESEGVPLSAFELSHDGERLARRGKLTVRRIGVDKPSLPLVDLLPFYRYIHLDLRTDWCTRPLRRGSPVGGDRATWWTARPDMHPELTSFIRVDDEARFNWSVNVAALYVLRASRSVEGGVSLTLQPSGYSPLLRQFQMSLDGSAWQPLFADTSELLLSAGEHDIAVRMKNANGSVTGPASSYRIIVFNPTQGAGD